MTYCTSRVGEFNKAHTEQNDASFRGTFWYYYFYAQIPPLVDKPVAEFVKRKQPPKGGLFLYVAGERLLFIHIEGGRLALGQGQHLACLRNDG